MNSQAGRGGKGAPQRVCGRTFAPAESKARVHDTLLTEGHRAETVTDTTE